MNLGLGAEWAEHVLYRIDLGIWESMRLRRERHGVKLWVLHVGSFTLERASYLKKEDMENYRIVVRALLEMGEKGCTILWTSLFLRKNMPSSVIIQSNAKIQAVIADLEKEYPGKVRYSPPLKVFSKDEHLHDHKHLNRAGYALWAAELEPQIRDILGWRWQQEASTTNIGNKVQEPGILSKSRKTKEPSVSRKSKKT